MRRVAVLATRCVRTGAARVGGGGREDQARGRGGLRGGLEGQAHGDQERAATCGKITKLKFQRVPLNCEDGQGGAISGRTLGSYAVRGKDFTRRTKISGTGIRERHLPRRGQVPAAAARSPSGSVRFSIKRTDGVGCGTGDLRWKAQKR